MTRLLSQVWKLLDVLWRDTSGLMLPYVTIMLVVIIGLALLAVDGSRYMSLQTQMQAAADALALAGARELDKKAGAETRAQNAIDNLVTNGLNGMGVTGALTHSEVFYKALPDASTGFGGTLATGDADAKFVAVTVDPVTVATVFPVSFIRSGGVNSFTARARAIAGNAGQQICKVPPVFVCNPYEAAGNTNEATATTALQNAIKPGSVGSRTEIKVLNDGNTGPGHFGWLVPPDGCTGADCLQTWVARNSPPECFKAGGVDLNTGKKEGALPAFNVRLDIGASAAQARDVNVRKGYVADNSGNWCNASLDAGTGNNQRAMGYPRDTSFTNFPNGGSQGNGQWDCTSYWAFNHQSAAAPTVRADGGSGVCGTPATTTLSRYDVYTYEINQSLVGDWSRGTLANNYQHSNNRTDGEIGAPMCAGAGDPIAGRRLIYLAVINCEANSASITGGATANDIPTAGFATFFLAEPVPTTGPSANRNLVGEIVGFANLTGGGVGVQAPVFNDVQLYR